jgi:hypothetical protein
VTNEQINRIFTYRAPFGDQPERYVKIRQAAKEFAHLVQDACPESREKSTALTHIQQAVMWANASIAINEEPPKGSEARE